MTQALRFEGTAKIDSPRAIVWDLLCDPVAFQRILPAVKHAIECEPLELYEVTIGVPFALDANYQTFAVEWKDVIRESEVSWVARSQWMSLPVEAKGHLTLEENTLLRFSAEIPTPPQPFPVALIHQLTNTAIRTYFTGLKHEAERQAPANLTTA